MSTKNKLTKLYPIFKSGRFFNPREVHKKKNGFCIEYFRSIKSILHEVAIFFKSFTNWKKRVPQRYEHWIEKEKDIIESSIEPSITWIGHATFLVQLNGVNILTDPIFGNVTPFFPRIFAPAITLNELPKIDYVVISHNHFDHMDSATLLNLKNRFPDVKFLVPYGDKKWFDRRKLSNNAFELTWWDEYEPKDSIKNIKFTFLPAHHWSQRGLFDQNKSLWGSWMIEGNGYSIYFAGDTGYSEHFASIAKEFPKIDVALMPVGPCEPREKMCHSHISAEEAGRAFIELGAEHFIPMHWGTYYFGVDYFDTPINRLNHWWNQNSKYLNFKKLNIVKFGQRLILVKAFQEKDIYQQKDLPIK